MQFTLEEVAEAMQRYLDAGVSGPSIAGVRRAP